MAKPRSDWGPALQGAALLAGGVVLLGTYLTSMGTTRNWWSPTVALQFRTYTAAGLKPGMAVKISGFTVGRVRNLQLQPDGQVLVNLDLGESYRPMVGRRSRGTLAQDSLLGNPYVALSPDPASVGGKGIGSGEMIVYDPSPDPRTLLIELAQTRIPLQKALGASANLAGKRIPATLNELDRTLASGRQLASSLQRDANSTAAQVRSTTDTVQEVLTNSANGSERLLPMVLQTLQEVQALAASSNAMLRKVQESWLFELISPPPDQPASAPPPAGQSPAGGR
ncbi:MlaD family protein [Synechococcus sp. FGCU-3]|nr:MlaD family protein [Synechococcus sp. FGCU3]